MKSLSVKAARDVRPNVEHRHPQCLLYRNVEIRFLLRTSITSFFERSNLVSYVRGLAYMLMYGGRTWRSFI